MLPRSSPRRKRGLPLKWEITLVLVIKAMLLYAIWALFFDQPVPKAERGAAVTRIILNQSDTE